MTVRTPVVADVNLADPATFRDGPPHEHFARLRAQAPVAWQHHPSADGSGFWVVTRYDDVMAVEHDPATFSSSSRLGGTLIEPAGADAGLHIINKDPPEHTRLRAHVRAPFTGRHISLIRDRVRCAARGVVAAVADRDRFDLVTEISAKIPPLALAELLEVPDEDRPRFLGWVGGLLSVDPAERGRAPSREAAELFAYIFELTGARAGDPARGPGVLAPLLGHEIDGHRADPLELCMFFLFLALAGSTTMHSAITGGTLALLRHPHEQARLRADRSLLPAAADEVLRYVSPVNYFRRTATRDTELAGVTIRAGDKVTVWYTSANRDEARFPDPGRFDVGRTPNQHVAFGGYGPHFCLGAKFARFQLTVVLAEILDQLLPRLELAGPVRHAADNHENAFTHMPVRRL